MRDPAGDSGRDLSLSLEEVAKLVGGRVEGDPSLRVEGIAPLEDAGKAELGFLAQRRYLKHLDQCQAEAVLVTEALVDKAERFSSRVVVKEAHSCLPALLAQFHPPEAHRPGIHSTAVLGNGVVLGEDVGIGPYAVLEEGVAVGDRVQIGAQAVLGAGSSVGEDSVLHPHVTLYPGTQLGARVILHSGVRVGLDGYGYAPVEGEFRKVPQVGQCIIEDDVEIGGNTCIDRGSIGSTVVGKGTKIDNLVHIAHNVRIGRGVMITAQVGMAGSARIGDRAMFGGQSGVGSHIQIGEGAGLGPQAGAIGDVPPGKSVLGFPARNQREFLRAMGQVYRLPDTVRRLEALEEKLSALGESAEK